MCNDSGIQFCKDAPPKTLFPWGKQSESSPVNMATTVEPTSHLSNGATVRHFEAGQRNAIEQLVELKNELREADTETFWRRLMEGITSICNAQYAFVASQPLELERSTSDPGEWATYPQSINVYYDGAQTLHGTCKKLLQRMPHSFVKSDKVYLVPERLGSSIGEQVDGQLSCLEACLAVPLFSTGKPFAHFGLMWTSEGLKKCDVSWAYLEMILHSLEDLILLRVSDEYPNRKHPKCHRTQSKMEDKQRKPRRNTSQYPTPYSPPLGSPSFKPYARSLSHELRTPMQGVVGMLDVMHATVQETINNKPDPNILPMFIEFRENIEAVQDSARRAIEAADNVVHAYDLNMQVPDTPELTKEDEGHTSSFRSVNSSIDNRPNILIEGSNISVNPYKRRKTTPAERSCPSSPKQRCIETPRREMSPPEEVSPRTADVKSAVQESDKIVHATPQRQMEQALMDAVAQNPGLGHDRTSSQSYKPTPIFPPLVLQYTKIRELLRLVIDESLHVGGRPDSAIAETTDRGERIEVTTKSSNGQASTKVIDWSVDPSVPDTLFFDEKDLAKLVSCVFLNALKFTESGKIEIKTTLSHRGRYVVITISDTGTGIPETFLPNLFKAFAREDGSTTRSKEGLGLGLLVAKGLSRKMGGDLTCVRSSTTGINRGSEFEIRLPMNPNDCVSRPGTPHSGTPAPSQTNSHPSLESDSSLGTFTGQSRTLSGSESVPSPSISPQKVECAESTSQDNGAVDLPEVTRRLSVTSRGTSFLTGHSFDRDLAGKYPLTFLVAEDNQINRKILVNMLHKLGYSDVYEAFDGKEAVRIMSEVLAGKHDVSSNATLQGVPTERKSSGNNADPSIDTGHPAHLTTLANRKSIDVVLMDLWMPGMDGYEATERILDMVAEHRERIAQHDPNAYVAPGPTVLAVSADVTDEALRRATKVGMEGYMTKPYKLSDLERLITEFCGRRERCIT